MWRSKPQRTFNPALSLDEQMTAQEKSWDWMKNNPQYAKQVAAQYRRELIDQIKAKICFWKR